MFGRLTQESTDRTFRIALCSCSASCGAKALVTASVPWKWVSISSRMSARSPVSSEAPVPEPALLMRIATSRVAAAAAATDAGSVTSSAIGVTPARSTAAGLRAAAYTVAPRSRSCAARCRPKPRLAPVTSAVFPVISIGLVLSWVGFPNLAWLDPENQLSRYAGGMAKNPEDACSIARTLGVVGERWTFLILREAFLGATRFAEFRDRLGVAPDVLSDRLATLVEFGVMAREPYREPGARSRFAYRLTPAGRELQVVLSAPPQR